MTDDLIRTLLARRGPEGGFRASGIAPVHTEATALACLALAATSHEDAWRDSVDWLARQQRPSGAWPASPDVAVDSWATPLAILAVAERHTDSARRGVDWMLAQEGRSYPWYVKLIYRIRPHLNKIKLDPDLTGWPWLPNTFSWVEPTAYAVLTLKRMPEPSDRALARIDEAERMLLDRMCLGGGWNYGNSRVLGEELWPYPDTTALALLALQGRSTSDAVRESFSALERMIEDNESGLTLALSIPCFEAHGRASDGLRARLLDNLDRVIEYGDTRSLSLASMALAETPHPFEVSRA